VEFARKEVKKIHNLNDTPITVVYPVLAYLPCLQPKKKKTGLEEPLLSDEDKKGEFGEIQPAENSELAHDPLMRYGYGIVAYRNTLFTMILAFLVFTVLAIPSIVLYSRGTAYSLSYKGTVGNEIYSIGNLGYSNIQCEYAPLGIGIVTMAC
jgi:hypothetical protein